VRVRAADVIVAHATAIVTIVATLAVLLAAQYFAQPAHAHDSWINRQGLRDPLSNIWCCGPDDCEDLTALGIPVTEEPNGDVRIGDTHERVESRRIIWASPEGHWYRCYEPLSEGGAPTVKRARCLIGPPKQS